MASNQYDASIKLLYITDNDTFYAADSLAVGQPFDVIANVEIGKELMHNVEDEKVHVSIVNLSKAKVLNTGELAKHIEKSEKPYNDELRVNIPAGWEADDGDVLEAVASYRVSTGLFTDYSVMHSQQIVATAGRPRG
jgi:hypothetical protein